MPKKPWITQLTSSAAFLLSVLYVYSVISNARDLIEQGVKNAPASYALIAATILLAYSWYNNGKKFNTLNIITITIFVTSIVIWLGGLSTRAR